MWIHKESHAHGPLITKTVSENYYISENLPAYTLQKDACVFLELNNSLNSFLGSSPVIVVLQMHTNGCLCLMVRLLGHFIPVRILYALASLILLFSSDLYLWSIICPPLISGLLIVTGNSSACNRCLKVYYGSQTKRLLMTCWTQFSSFMFITSQCYKDFKHLNLLFIKEPWNI